jgi:hypothetical protein
MQHIAESVIASEEGILSQKKQQTGSMSKKAEWTEEELLEMLVETRKTKLEKLQKEEAEAKESNRVPPPSSSWVSSSAASLEAPALERDWMPARTEIKRKREDVQADSRMDASFKKVKGTNELKKNEALPAKRTEDWEKPEWSQSRSRSVECNESPPELPLDHDRDERETKSAPEARKLGKTTKDESEMASKERLKRTPNCKKERIAKREKFYKEENEVDDEDKEIVMRGVRTSFEVYHEYFGEELVCDESHRSLKKQGNCTVIKDASASLLKEMSTFKWSVWYGRNVMTIAELSYFLVLAHLMYTSNRQDGRVCVLPRSC